MNDQCLYLMNPGLFLKPMHWCLILGLQQTRVHLALKTCHFMYQKEAYPWFCIILLYCFSLSLLQYLHHRHKLILVCLPLRSLIFWTPNGPNKLPEVYYERPFILIGKKTMSFLTGQSWYTLKSWCTGGGPEQGFLCCFAGRFNQS